VILTATTKENFYSNAAFKPTTV